MGQAHNLNDRKKGADYGEASNRKTYKITIKYSIKRRPFRKNIGI